MNEIPEELRVVAERVMKGEVPRETVRTLLSWFGQHRRGLHVVNNIRSVLEKVHLKTDPDFELSFFDGPVAFLTTSETENEPETKSPENIPTGKIVSPTPAGLPRDPVVRVEILKAANNSKFCVVSRDTPLEEAITQMSICHFSQLPVMQGQTRRDVQGMISWKSIGEQMAWGRKIQYVRDCMEQAEIILWSTPLITAVSKIVEHQVVLVRGKDGTITGLITTTDLALEFRKLSEPFLLLGEIENHVRRIIHGKFSLADLIAAKNPTDVGRNIENVSDLTMGEYIRLLDHPENWKRLECRLDRKTFIDRLKAVRELRNEVMHFHPDPVEPEDIATLQEIAQFFRRF